MNEQFSELPPVQRTRKGTITGTLIVALSIVVLVAVAVVPLLDGRRAGTPDESSPGGSAIQGPPPCLANGTLVSFDAPGDAGHPDGGQAIILDMSTGDEVARIPVERARQVVDLGPIIGLVDSRGVMSAVAPADLRMPLWSVPLVDDDDVIEFVGSEVIDDDHVLVSLSLSGQDADGTQRVVRVSDGTSPPWARPPTGEAALYEFLGDVVLRSSGVAEEQQTIAMDTDGNVLWAFTGGQSSVLGSSLYLLDQDHESFAYAGIRLVDSVSGETLAEFLEEYSYVTAIPGDRVGVFSEAQWVTLDAKLSEEDRQSMSRRILAFADDEHVFIGRFTAADHERMEAFTPDVEGSVWSRDLIPDQRLDKYGPHFITYDEDNGVIQGIKGPQ